MLFKTRAIVLHHVSYGESSIIVTLYTGDHGRIACMVNGVRTKKPRFPATFFQPLSMLDIDFYYRSGREVQRLKDAIVTFHYSTVPYNYSKNAIALFLAEVLYLALREEESNPPLFSFLFNALQLFDANDRGISTFHHWFMLQLTRYLGFLPPEQLFSGTTFHSGELQAFSGLVSELNEALKLISDNPQSPPDLSRLSHDNRNELLKRIIQYYSLHIDGFSRLRSFSILQEVFGK